MACCKASMDIFDEVGMENLEQKSLILTNFMEFILNDISERYDNCNFEIITPKETIARGCQLSVLMHQNVKLQLFFRDHYLHLLCS